MKKIPEKKDLSSISLNAMKAQRTSFQLEGIDIPEERAEQIRREIVEEIKSGSLPARHGS